MAIEDFDQVTIAPAKLRPFSKFIMSIGELPTSYLDSLSYAEQVTWFCDYLQNHVIPALNNNASALQEVQNLMTQLQEYVDNYFTNLDVQEEINNKLDSMIEDGTLENLIGAYIQPRIDEQNANILDFENRTSNQLSSYNTRISAVESGSPLVASSTSGMTDTDRVYVNTTDGKWYYYDGDSWEIGGTYQSTGIDPDNTVIVSKLDKQEVKEEITFTTESGLIDMSLNVYAGDIFEHTKIENVTAGDVYYVSGVSTNTSYVGAFVRKGGTGAIAFINSSSTNFVDLEVTIPANYTGGDLYINGYTNRQPVDVKIKSYQDSEDYWEEFSNLKTDVNILQGNIAARRDGNNIYFFKHGYKEDTDLIVWLKRKASNSLMDFYLWLSSTNESNRVITALPDALSRTEIIGGDTDFLAPSVVYATSNIDGDFPTYDGNKWSGGWHGYNNATSGASATAREISCNLYVDGEEVTDGNYKIGKEILLKIVNNLQGSNTQKENGTGREILQQIFYITMNDQSNKITVDCELKPLENIIIATHYGISFYRKADSDYGYILNSNDIHNKFTMDSLVRDTDKTATGAMEVITANSINAIFTMLRDPLVDLGKGYAINNNYGQIVTGKKAYNMFITSTDTETNGLALTSNDIVRWRGYYDVNPIV